MRLNASVVLPVRDGRAHLDACLDSLGRQTLRGWELVVVDDGSVDDSAAHVQRWSQAEGVDLTLVRTPPRGVAAALAAGCDAAQGEILIRMDADDVCAPARIERQLDALSQSPETAVVSSLAEPLGEVGSGTERLHRWQNGLLTDAAMKADLFVDAPFPHSAVALRRSALEAVGGYRDAGWPEDYDLWHRLARSGARFGKVAEVLLWVRDHAGRVTRTRPEASQGALLDAKVHHLLTAGGPLNGVPEVVVWGAGKVGKRFVRRIVERPDAPRVVAIVDLHPRKIGKTIHGAPVVRPEALVVSPLLGVPVLAAVGKPGARLDIRRRCAEVGSPAPLAVA